MSFLYKNVAAKDAAEFKVGDKVRAAWHFGGAKDRGVIVKVGRDKRGIAEYSVKWEDGSVSTEVNKGDVVAADSAAQDSAEFKVGDKVKESFWGDGWKVKRVVGKNEKGEQLYVCENNLHSELVFNEKNMKKV